MLDRKTSYTAAGSVPLKLLMLPEPGRLRPIHVQWVPTNRCNLRCEFCSCSARDRSLEMSLDQAIEVIDHLAELGCLAATITGGGEPLMQSGFPTMVKHFRHRGVEVGLVTNGTLLHVQDPSILKLLTWCRVSCGDEREFTPVQAERLSRVTHLPVDWSFSYVVGVNPDVANARRVVDFAHEHEFTHVRLVGDLLHPEEVPFDEVSRNFAGDDLVLMQPRKQYVRGHDCLICYVKPLIAPDFRVYMCCGVQYALDPMSLDLPQALCLGSALDLGAIYADPRPQKVPCVRCYYQDYNDLLGVLSDPIRVKHRRFV